MVEGNIAAIARSYEEVRASWTEGSAKKPVPLGSPPRARRRPSPAGTSATSTSGVRAPPARRHDHRGRQPVFNETAWRSLVPKSATGRDGCNSATSTAPIIIEDKATAPRALQRCGICAKECPTGAIVMKLDEKE
jgi:ferredoxin